MPAGHPLTLRYAGKPSVNEFAKQMQRPKIKRVSSHDNMHLPFASWESLRIELTYLQVTEESLNWSCRIAIRTREDDWQP